MAVIAIDFDGTIATDSFPDALHATPNKVVIDWIKRRQKKGDRFILWTCRENYGGKNFPDHEYKNDAIRFCTMNQLFFDRINSNIDEVGYEPENFGRKIMADFYIDDKSVSFKINSKFSSLFWKIYLYFIGRRIDTGT